MKGLLIFWLLCAGSGVSYSVITERKHRIDFLREMEHDLKRLAYHMCEWRMPVEEAIDRMVREGGRFQFFYERIHKKLKEKRVVDFGELWCKESDHLFTEMKLPKEIFILWTECFFHIPMEPETVKKQLFLKSQVLSEKRSALEEKYKGEQRLVFSMGFFVSAFLCLILW